LFQQLTTPRSARAGLCPGFFPRAFEEKHDMRQVLAIGLLFSVAAVAAVNPPAHRTPTKSTCSGKAFLEEVTGILSVGGDCSTVSAFDNTNDKAVAIGKPASTVSETLQAHTTDSTNNCSSNGQGTSTADTYYPTTANYFKGQMFARLSSNNSKDMRVLNATYMPSDTDNPGTKYSTLTFMDHGGAGTYHACRISNTDTRVFCKGCGT